MAAPSTRNIVPLLPSEAAAEVARPVQVSLVAVEQRRSLSGRVPPSTFIAPAPIPQRGTVNVSLVAVERALSRRRYISSVGRPQLATAVPLAPPIEAKLTQARPRPTDSKLYPPAVLVAPAAAFVASPVRVALAVQRRSLSRQGVSSELRPPTALQVFEGPSVALARIKPLPVRSILFPPREPRKATSDISVTLAAQSRGRPRSKLFPPGPVRAQSGVIGVHLVRIRPPAVRSKFLPGAIRPQTGSVEAALVRTRPPRTTSFLRKPTVLQTFVGPSVHLARIRPPAVRSVRVVGAIRRVANVVIQTQLTTIRPAKTATFLRPPTVLQVFPGPQTHLVQTRPPAVRSELFPPGPVRRVSGVPEVTTVETRPPAVHSRLAPPASIAARPLARPVEVSLARITPPPIHTVRVVGAIRAQSGVVEVSLARHPKPRTRSFLLPPTALKTFVGPRATLAAQPTQGRKTRSRQIVGAIRRQTGVIDVTTSLRPRVEDSRRAPHSKLSKPAVVLLVAPPLAPPTDVTLAAVQSRLLRQRRIIAKLGRPVATFAVPVVPPIRVVLAPARRPSVTTFLRPPIAVTTAVTAELRTVMVAARAQRRTQSFLRPPTQLATFEAARTQLARIRPRPVSSTLRPPTALQTFSAARTHLVAPSVRPQEARWRLAAPTAVLPPPPVEPTRTWLVRRVERPGRGRLRPPVVIFPFTQPFAPGRVYLTAVAARQSLVARIPRYQLRPPGPTFQPGVACLIDLPAAVACLDDLAATLACLTDVEEALACLTNLLAARACLTDLLAAVACLEDE